MVVFHKEFIRGLAGVCKTYAIASGRDESVKHKVRIILDLTCIHLNSGTNEWVRGPLAVNIEHAGYEFFARDAVYYV